MTSPTPQQYEDADPKNAARALREAVAELDVAYERIAPVRPYQAERWQNMARAFFLRLALAEDDAAVLWTRVADLRALLAQCNGVIAQMEEAPGDDG